jgi:hypothetical protein
MIRTLTALVLTAILAAAGAAVMAPPAAASDTYAGQHPLDQPEVNDLVDAGLAFHAHRGVSVERPPFFTAPHLPAYGSAGEDSPWTGMGEPRCLSFPPSYGFAEVVCGERWTYQTLATIRNRYLPTYFRREAYVGLCTVVFHELGHVGGIALPVFRDGRWHDGHPMHGLMGRDMTTPGDCWAMAVKRLPRRPVRHHKRGHR